MSRNVKVTWWFQKHVPVETGMWKMKHCYVCNHFKIFMIKKKKKAGSTSNVSFSLERGG